MKGKIFTGCLACWLLPWVSVNCIAADILTSQSGAWTSTSTWVGGVVPVQGDNATIKNGHTVTIPGSGIKTCTNLLIENGGKLYANTGGTQRYIDVYGNITCNGVIGNGSVYDGISFNIEGPACLITGSGEFNASRIRKNTGTNSSTTLTIAMDMDLRYNGTAIFNNKSASNFHIIIDPGRTLNCPGNGASTGNVCIDGNNGSNGSSLGGSITVNGTLSVSGILYLTTDNNSTAYTVTFTVNNGGVVNAASVVCSNSGSACHLTTISDGAKMNFTSGDWGTIGTLNNSYDFGFGSIIEYSGTGIQNVGNPAEYGHLIVSGSGEKTVYPGDLIINGDLTVQNGCSFVIPQSRAVTLEGNFYLNSADGLFLKAGNSVAPPGSFINHGSVAGTGSVKVERFISKYLSANDANYHLISSPVGCQNIQPEFVSEPPENSTDFYRWDEQLAQWINSKTEAGLWNTDFQPGDDRSFRQGHGYLAAYASDVIKSYSGNICNSNMDIPLTFTSGDYEGFNLVGNPFTSAIKGDIHTWSKTNVLNALWVWNPSSGNYDTWNGITGTLAEGIIPAMQGFFVKASSGSPSFVIPAESRIHRGQAAYMPQNPRILNILLSDSNYHDESVLYIPNPPLELPDTMFNVPKLMGFHDAPQIYFLDNSRMFSIRQLDSLPLNLPVYIGIQKGKADSLRLEFSGIQTFSTNDAFFLEDRVEDKIIDLREQTVYDFVSHQQQENGRFLLQYKNTTGIQASSILEHVKMYSENGNLRIEGLEEFKGNKILWIYDMAGRKVLERLIPPGTVNISPDLAPAFYLVRLGIGKTSISKKLLFKQ